MKLPILLLAVLAVLVSAVRAHEGHAEAAPDPSAQAAAAPRLTAASEAFELVGVLDGRRLVLWLDRYADNAPVRDARIELDIAGAKHVAAPADDGTYAVLLDAAPKPGLIAVAATIAAGADSDLLAGELDVHEAAAAADADAPSRWRTAAIAAVAIAVVSALPMLARRRRGAAR